MSDQSRMPPLLTLQEQAEWMGAKLAYEQGHSSAFLDVSLSLQTVSKQRVLDRFRAGTATRAAATDAIEKYGMAEA